jgi:hypothetical protein
MTIVSEYPWESDPSPDQRARQAWCAAVAAIAAKAHAKLPECNGRVDSAVKIVLAGDVALLPDGTARVASQSNGTTEYHVVNGHCDCRDYEKAPHNLCKHRLSAAIARRAQELVKAQGDGATNGQAEAPSQPAPPAAAEKATPPEPVEPPAPAASLLEAPVSITLKATLHGHEVLVTLRGVDFTSVKAQVEAASEWLKVQVPVQGTEQAEGWCARHGVQMTQNHKDGHSWWSHKTATGWCKGKLCRESGK